jgi:hypothetical protein
VIRARSAATLVALALAVGALAPAAAASAQQTADGGSVGIRLLDAPTDRRDDPRALVYVIDHLAPGSTIERRVEVANDTPAATDIQLYAAAADVEGGSFVFLEGREGNELTDWISVDPTRVTIPEGGTAEATVRIDVASDASEGEHYAVVWAELPAGEGGDVTVINRVGVRIYLSVGPGGEPPSDFSIRDLTARRTPGGVPQVIAGITNTGGRALDLTGELTLRDGPGGASAGPFPARLGTTLGVGGSGDVLLELDPALPDGPWRAELTLRSGRVEQSLTATIAFPPPGEDRDVAAVRAGPQRTALLVGAGLLLALAVLVLLIAWRRRSRSNGPTAAPEAGTRVPG